MLAFEDNWATEIEHVVENNYNFLWAVLFCDLT